MKKMKFRSSCFLVFFLLFATAVFSQSEKALRERGGSILRKTSGAFDRAGNNSNASNIGMFMENRGKLYPRSNADGPSGEFPINSQKNYIWKINPIVAFPNNIISGQSPSVEEWEAAAGYHSSKKALIASSTDSTTWPSSGWPTAFRTESDGTIDYLSEQTLFSVYNDSTNQKQILGIEIAQTSYAYGSKPFDNFIIFRFDVKNNSNNTYNDMYFGFHHDIDVGNYSGGVAEFADDLVGYDSTLQLVYFYDDGYSSEWPGHKTGFFGLSFIKTPKVNGKELGLTDWHYAIYENDESIQTNDTIVYQILSSSPKLYSNPDMGPIHFHPGSFLPNIKRDDVKLIPSAGNDYGTKMGSGPYTLGPHQTLSYYAAVVAGNTKAEILNSATNAKYVIDKDFNIPRPPKAPTLKAVSGDGYVKLYWDTKAEESIDLSSAKIKDFQGYRLYKSIDNGITWDQVDRNELKDESPSYPVPVKEWDLIDGIGDDRGIEYSYVDSSVVNGIEYWYTLTAFDYSGTAGIPSYESSRGRTSSQKQLAIAIPQKTFSGYTGFDLSQVKHRSGIANDSLVLKFENLSSLEALNDTVKFELLYKKKAKYNGKEKFQVVKPELFPDDIIAVVYSNPIPSKLIANMVKIYNYNKKTSPLGPRYPYTVGDTTSFYGVKFTVSDSTIRPQNGDTVFFFPGTKIVSGSTIKFPLKAFENGKPYFTSDGLEFKIQKSDFVTDYLQVSGSNPLNLKFTYTDTSKLKYQLYSVKVISVLNDTINKIRLVLQIKSEDESISVSDTLKTGEFLTIPGMKISALFSNSSLSSAPLPNSLVTFKLRKPHHITLNDQWVIKTGERGYDKNLAHSVLNKIRVVPNPYISSSSYEKAISKEVTKDVERQIRFINLPKNSEIHIFTLDGSKIKTLHNGLEGEIFWNMLNDYDREIASGMYLYQVKSDAGSFVGKFGVIK